MIIALDESQRKLLQSFFINMENTFIHTYLQGHMGRGWTDSLIRPSLGLIQIGDFCFINGLVNRNMKHVLANLHQITDRDTILLIPGNENIRFLIQRNFPKWEPAKRFAFQHNPEAFDIPYLQQVINCLPKEYELVLIDERWYLKALSEEWSRDLISNFDSPSDFLTRGIGLLITCNGEILSGASSYSIYDGGIEIQVDTNPAYRMKGLGYIVCAAFIIACRERNLYPSWDAANEISMQLAKKLGYRYSHSYNIYHIDR